MRAHANTGLRVMFGGFVLTILVLAGMVACEQLGWIPDGGVRTSSQSP